MIDPPDDLALMQEEIFGPILPIKPYRTLDDAIAYINGGPRPLALYVFTDTPSVAERVIARTTSGGACVNAVSVQAAVPSLPFGGIGNSGMGFTMAAKVFKPSRTPEQSRAGREQRLGAAASALGRATRAARRIRGGRPEQLTRTQRVLVRRRSTFVTRMDEFTRLSARSC